jgi:hypothetical protein
VPGHLSFDHGDVEVANFSELSMDPEDREHGKGHVAHAKTARISEIQGFCGSREDGGFDTENDGLERAN